MHNGRSAGFHLKRDELEQLLSKCEGDTTVGKTQKRKPLAASELRQVLVQWKGNEIPVEEQDHAWYIVQLPETEFDRWFVAATIVRFLMGFADIMRNGAKIGRRSIRGGE
jgi:hypothetical protein